MVASRPNELKAGAILSFIALALQFIVAILFTPVMLRLLGQSEYGLYTLVASIVGYLNLLSFGMGSAYMRFYARIRISDDPEGVARLNALFLLVFSTLGFFAASGGVVLSISVDSALGDQFSDAELATARSLFVILAINLTVTLSVTVFSAYVIAHERFIFQKLLQIVRIVVNPAITIPVLLAGYQSIGMAVALTSTNIAFSAYTAIYCFSKLNMRFSFAHLEFSLLREVSVFSSFIFMNMLVDQINWNVDKLIIGRFHGSASVAVYGVASLLNGLYITFSTAISGVFIPRVNRMIAASASDQEISDLFIRIGRIQFLILALVVSGFIFFGRPFLVLWAGQGYQDGYSLALLLLVPVTVPLIQNLGIEIQRARNLHQFRSWVYLGVALANVLFSIPLTRDFGPVGAASATAIALLVGHIVIMNWHYQFRLGLEIGVFWREILHVSRGLFPAAVVGTAIMLLADLTMLSSLFGFGILYVLVYFAGMWFLGMNAYERHLVRSSLSATLRLLRWKGRL